MLMIENEYNIGDIVYLKTDEKQLQRLLFAIEISSTGLLYRLACGEINTYHYAIEMTTEKSFVSN